MMSSQMRFLNAYSGIDALDIYTFDDFLLCQNLYYKKYSDYYDVAKGNLYFKLCHPRKKYFPLLDVYTYVEDNSYQTAIISGSQDDFSLYVVADAYLPISYNKAFIRFANLDPDSPGLDFTFVDDSFILFNDVQYKEVTDYYPVNADTYNIKVKITGTKQTILTIYNVTLQPNRFYTIFIMGINRAVGSKYLMLRDGAN